MHPPSPTVRAPRRILQLLAALAVTTAAGSAQAAAEQFFGLCAVHDIHLRVEAAAWQQMQPTESPGPGAGPPRPDQPGAGNRPPRDPAEPRRPGLTRWEFPWVRASFECDGQTLAEVGLRFKGNSSFNNSRRSIKRPLKVDFNRFVKGQKLHGLTQLNLSNNTLDPSQMREALACDIFRAAGLPAARTAFARVHLTVPGSHQREYLGLYTIIEEVDNRFLERAFGDRQGLLLKPELPPGLVYLGEAWEPYERAYAPKSDASGAERQLLRGFLRLIEDADDATFAKDLGRYLDVEQLLDFVAVNVAVANLDSFLLIGHNFYLFAPAADARFRFLPWDLNHAFGGFPMAGSDRDQAELGIASPFHRDNRLLTRVLAVDGWRQRYRQSLQKLLAGPFASDRVAANIQAIAAAIGDDVARDPTMSRPRFLAAVFAGQGAAADTGAAPDRPLGPTMPLLTWVEQRTRSLADQLAGKAAGRPVAFRPPGGPRPGPRAPIR